MRDATPLHRLPPIPLEPVLPQPSAAAPEIAMPVSTRRANGIDGHSLKQLQRGDRAIEATIDLHGMTLAAAHPALKRFIAAQAQAQRRCLLVITGKGGPDRPSALKREVPLWLVEWKPPVLAVVPAAPRHGGGGAFYVLLQRRR